MSFDRATPIPASVQLSADATRHCSGAWLGVSSPTTQWEPEPADKRVAGVLFLAGRSAAFRSIGTWQTYGSDGMD
jgi:hypothetical protein